MDATIQHLRELNYEGVDETKTVYYCGIIFFVFLRLSWNAELRFFLR